MKEILVVVFMRFASELMCLKHLRLPLVDQYHLRTTQSSHILLVSFIYESINLLVSSKYLAERTFCPQKKTRIKKQNDKNEIVKIFHDMKNRIRRKSRKIINMLGKKDEDGLLRC